MGRLHSTAMKTDAYRAANKYLESEDLAIRALESQDVMFCWEPDKGDCLRSVAFVSERRQDIDSDLCAAVYGRDPEEVHQTYVFISRIIL